MTPARERDRPAEIDRCSTMLQETGECSVQGLTWAGVYQVLRNLAIDPREAIISGGRLLLLGPRTEPSA